MKKDVYVLIARGSHNYLFAIRDFVCKAEYADRERELYPEDVGKISTYDYEIRFRYYNNVIFENDKPSKLNDIDNLGHDFVTVGCTDERWCIKCKEEDHIIRITGEPCKADLHEI